MSAVITLALVFVVSLAGCLGSPQAKKVKKPVLAKTNRNRIDLNGLVVTFKTSTHRKNGLDRLIVNATAINSTDHDLCLQIEHNAPSLKDERGEPRNAALGYLRSNKSFGGESYKASKNETAKSRKCKQAKRIGQGLKPRGVLESMRAYDLDTKPQQYKVVWGFEHFGTASYSLDWPPN